MVYCWISTPILSYIFHFMPYFILISTQFYIELQFCVFDVKCRPSTQLEWNLRHFSRRAKATQVVNPNQGVKREKTARKKSSSPIEPLLACQAIVGPIEPGPTNQFHQQQQLIVRKAFGWIEPWPARHASHSPIGLASLTWPILMQFWRQKVCNSTKPLWLNAPAMARLDSSPSTLIMFSFLMCSHYL